MKNGVTPHKNNYEYQNVLITGGAGFIGANFVRFMLHKYPHYRIIAYDKLTYAGNLDNLLGLEEAYAGRYVFVKGDICNADQVTAVMQQYEIDLIVNFAAESHVDRSLMNPAVFLRTNIEGTYVLLEVARQFAVKRFHQVSTDEVYGQIVDEPFHEKSPLETRNPYSACKGAADLLVKSYQTSFGVPTTITRGSNNIGPYQYPEKAVPLFVTNAIDNLPLPVYGDGLYVRDYQYVLDHCQAIDLVLHKSEPGETYNIANGAEHTTIEVAQTILDKLNKPYSLICLVDDRPGQDRRYSLNCTKIRQLGWRPQWPFVQSLNITIEWYIENEWWWRKIKQGVYKDYYDKQFSDRLKKVEKAKEN